MIGSTLIVLALPCGSFAQKAQQPTAAPSVSKVVDSSTYVIGPADVLEVTVWKEPTLSGPVTVRPDGKISLTLLGDLPAAGTTSLGLADRIKEGLQKYIQDPSVFVVVTAVNSKRVFLVGEIQHVGPISLTSGMTPLQAIATAGGLTPFANSKHIYILRLEGSGQVKIPFNYKQALKGNGSQSISLLAGDTIVVP
jgi:polysaccharide export outer membrane protein